MQIPCHNSGAKCFNEHNIVLLGEWLWPGDIDSCALVSPLRKGENTFPYLHERLLWGSTEINICESFL